jgi:small subunit ribosomal protein S8e
MLSQSKSSRKISGGKYKTHRKKRLYEQGRSPALTKVGKKRLKIIKTFGGNKKFRLLTMDIANILDPKNKKYSQAKIKRIIENPANRHFVRRNIITKGCVIETEIGKAMVTSRPGQDGIINAILVS